ncbi:Uncharacterised protein [Mycobacteroides abscessus subsp. abscessus]|nr:Uncharacterised protein [Mycobacteroides abscessus subsp. abscessus]
MPISISSPISEGMPSGVSVTSRPSSAPVAAKGIDTARISGWTSDLKVATITT